MGSSPYLFRSGLNAGIMFAEDCRPAAFPRQQLKQAIAEAKRLRPYFFGDFYALGPVTVRPEDWCVLQYHRPQKQDGMVMAFRRDASRDAIHTVGANDEHLLALHLVSADGDGRMSQQVLDNPRPAWLA